MPLESQEWCKVQDLYKQYAVENNWIAWESDPLKTKFWNLANPKKPMGNVVFPPWIREVKHVDKAIHDCAYYHAIVDTFENENENFESDEDIG